MKRLCFAVFALICLVIASGGEAQRLSEIDKPMWEMESLKVRPGMFGFTLGYLDDNWMRAREEAKRQGAIVSYHRFVEQESSGRPGNIVLLTEYTNLSTYEMRGTLFAEITKRLPKPTSDVIRPSEPSELFQNLGSSVFVDYPETDTAKPRLLSKR